MNNELISKIAELLQITTQKASELYPQLVNETVISSVIVNSVLVIISVDALACLFWLRKNFKTHVCTDHARVCNIWLFS